MRATGFMGAALAVLAGVGLGAQEIVDAAGVAAAQGRGALVWDVRSAEDYAKGHIPGAINLGAAASVLRDPQTEDFLPTPQVARLLSQAGLDLAKEVIVYSRTGDSVAHWGLLAVRHFGGQGGKVFHGGLDAWQAAGRTVATEPTRPAPIDQQLRVRPGALVFLDEVLAQVGNPAVQFVDVRTPKEFSGEDIRALRGGHIPGARNIPFEQNWADPATSARLARGEVKTREGAALKTPEQLKALYAGLDPARETIVYCQSGVRAAETATVLRSLGFQRVRVFEESWLGYGNHLAAPVEQVRFFNLSTLQGQIRSLTAEVESLRAEVATLKARKP